MARFPSLGRRGRGVVSCLLALLLPVARLAGQPGASEYQVKAVFLFNFAQFVDWPEEGFSAPDAPLVVGILGTDPFGSTLDDVIRNESVSTHKLTVRRLANSGEIAGCQILFISASEAGRLDRVIAELHGRPILTVSDVEGSARRGVMIRFISDKGRIRLRINLEAARQAGLQISSKLLRRAEIVGRSEAP